jgi:hypothetical protein
MFEINENKLVEGNRRNMTFDTSHALLEYNNDILLSYCYKADNTIALSALIDIEVDSWIEYYFQMIIDENTLNNFLIGEISLLNIIKNAENLSAIGTKDGLIVKQYKIQFDEIPQCYLPTADSFYNTGS